MIDDRKAAILRAVVTEYIQTAQPVGSAHAARASEINVSPATVRHEMAVLEHEGYLRQPHTSAGRVPTDRGYRYFVDQLATPGTLDRSQRQRVRDFFALAHGELEDMLAATSKLLSQLTDYAAVVVGPAHEAATVRSAQLVSLGPHHALLVVVLSNGSVEKRRIELAEELDEARMAIASAQLAAQLMGRSLGAAGAGGPGSLGAGGPGAAGGAGPVASTGDPALDALLAAALDAISRPSRADEIEHVFVGGASRMASAFDAVETVRSVLGILEQQYVVVTLLRDVLDRGLSVSIGTEHGVASLAECAVVVAPYGVEGDLGTVGVLGPTRMNYPQALAAVAMVSRRLGRHLSEG